MIARAGLPSATLAIEWMAVEKGGRRPSFVDTGLYVASFKAWIT